MGRSGIFKIALRQTLRSHQTLLTNFTQRITTNRAGRSQKRWYTLSQENLPLSPYIGDCKTNRNAIPSSKDGTDFKICFLGTGAGVPSRQRICSATLLQMHGTSILLDAAEGVQRQIMHSSITLSSISHIFITHLHGDHIFGLPGLILGIQLASQSYSKSSSDRSEGLTLKIYGPPGIYNYVAMSLRLSMSRLFSGKIIVTELLGGHADPGFNQKSGRHNNYRDPRHTHYKEMSRRNLYREALKQNKDGTWTFQVPFTAGPSTEGLLSVSAAEVRHVNDVMTFGYVIQEPEPEPNIIVEKARALGVEPGRKYRLLKKGIPVESDDGSKTVLPEQVLSKDMNRKERKFALIGDNCQLSRAMYQLCQDCDVLVHEATLIGSESLHEEAMLRGHSTPETAGSVAKDVNASLLVMNHISAKIDPGTGSEEVENSAKETNDNTSYIVAAEDFMELLLPKNGYERKASPLELADTCGITNIPDISSNNLDNESCSLSESVKE